MENKCQGTARRTGQQCRKRCLIGSKYCLFHIEHTPVLYGALLGAVMSLMAAIAYGEIVPSKELNELKWLRHEIEPLQVIAKGKFPDRPSQEALRKLIIEIPALIAAKEDLVRKATEYQNLIRQKDSSLSEMQHTIDSLKRGATTSYEFNGMKRESAYAGHLNLVTDTPEASVFKVYMNLHDAHDWKSLRNECQKQIKRNPQWLTSYFYLGVAYANLGESKEAIKCFQHVKTEAGSNPAYQQVNDFLQKLQPTQ